jgi:hypothetical protein
LAEDAPTPAEAFVQFTELLADAHAFIIGQRTQFCSEGFSETAAEQMTVELWSAWVHKVMQ